MKLSTLKKKAQKRTHSRGHLMRWVQTGEASLLGQCHHCGMWVRVLRAPKWDYNAILGRATAIDCESA